MGELQEIEDLEETDVKEGTDIQEEKEAPGKTLGKMNVQKMAVIEMDTLLVLMAGQSEIETDQEIDQETDQGTDQETT